MGIIEKAKHKVSQQDAQKREERRQRWQTWLDNPLLFSALIVSGFLSHLAGWFLGLGVSVDNGVVAYTLDAPHIFTACLYAALFPAFFEYGLANWLDKYLKREPDNKIQEWTAFGMVAFTGLGALITAFSAADIIATTLGFFTSFTDIPPEVQRWMVYSLPIMLSANVACGEIYRQNSLEAKLIREVEMEIRSKRIEADMNVRIAQMTTKADISIHAAEEYANAAKGEVKKLGADRGQHQWTTDRKKFETTPTTRVYASDTDNLQIVPKDNAEDFTQGSGK